MKKIEKIGPYAYRIRLNLPASHSGILFSSTIRLSFSPCLYLANRPSDFYSCTQNLFSAYCPEGCM